MVKLWLTVEGANPVEGLEDLAGWLNREPELQGRVKVAAKRPDKGELGVVATALLASVGAGGTVSVLAASLKGYLTQPRRSDIRITVEEPGGRKVEIEAKRIGDVAGLLRQLLAHKE